MLSEVTELLSDRRRPRILVVGDVMLDRYLWGDVDRISAEAPIPVFRVDRREDHLGGAGSVVAILAALDVDVVLVSITGDDTEGRIVRDLLTQLDVPTDGVLSSADRPTTVKERLLGRTQSRHPQQMIRVDRESTAAAQGPIADELMRSIQRHLSSVDLVLVSDYAKGVCGGNLVPSVVSAAREAGVRVVVDPALGVDYRRYRGCTCATPNRTEAGLAIGTKILHPEQGREAARRLLDFGFDSVIVKLDRDGMAWAEAGGRQGLFPIEARQVYDITGAGDAVLAALGLALSLGADWPAAIELANLAGGLEVQRLGVVPFTRAELLEELGQERFSTRQKLFPLDKLLQKLEDCRRRGERIVMTNGCFDLLHPGHVALLQFARRQGDCLVVGLNSDQSVRSLKGPGHPVVDQVGRADVLAALGCVDCVVWFDDTSVAGLVERIRPDVLVKADQYAPEQVVGHEFVRSYGGQVVLAPMKGCYSTSRLIASIRNGHGESPLASAAEEEAVP